MLILIIVLFVHLVMVPVVGDNNEDDKRPRTDAERNCLLPLWREASVQAKLEDQASMLECLFSY